MKEIGGYGGSGESPSPVGTNVDSSILRHPAYSINNILGMHQQDANENILKRKRDDDGKFFFLTKLCRLMDLQLLDEIRDVSNHVDPSFKRIRTQYSSAYSSWAGQLAGSWVKQQLDIKQEKVSGSVAPPEPENVSPVQSPNNVSPYPPSFPDTNNVNFANYDTMAHHNSVYAAALNPSSAGTAPVQTFEL